MLTFKYNWPAFPQANLPSFHLANLDQTRALLLGFLFLWNN